MTWCGVAHVAEPCEPTQMPVWCGHVVHGGHMAGQREPTRMLGWRLRGMQSNRLASDGPMGIVGPGKSIWAVMQTLTGLSPFIVANFKIFFCVGLCSLYFFICRTRGVMIRVR